MHEDCVFTPELLPHLANRLEEWQGLNVADGTPDFDDGYIRVGRHLAHGGLDFIGHVGNDLDCLAQVVAAALFGNDLLVNPASGEIVVAAQSGMGKPLVVAQVQIGFRAIIGHKHLAVLERREGPGINVEIRVELHQVNAEAAAFQQTADGGGG